MGKLKVTGIVLTTVAVIAIIAVLIMSLVLPMGFWTGAEKAKNSLDDWADTAQNGERITVSGSIESKKDHSVLPGVYVYKFKGADTQFTATQDIGDEGSMVCIELQNTGMPDPEVYSQTNSFGAWIPNICCGGLSVILVIIGLILLLVGLKKDKKAALEKPPEPQPIPGDQGQVQQAAPQPVPTPVYQPPVDPIEAAKKRQHELNQKVAMQTGWNAEQPPRQ